MKRFLTVLLLAGWLLVMSVPASAGSPAFVTASREIEPTGPVIDPQVQQKLDNAQPDDLIPVIIKMKQQADLKWVNDLGREERARRVVAALRDTARSNQAVVLALLKARQGQNLVRRIQPFWIFNGFSIEATPGVITELASHPDIAAISAEETFLAPAPLENLTASTTNIDLINAPVLWSLGYNGQGVVVASMDTGVYLSHPAYQDRWRGGSNSWFDPYQEHPLTPVDMNGHGTQVMGVMVGNDAGGTGVGVAPGAQWIAVKIFNDQGVATTSAIHAGYQWLLDPDGNPATSDAPNVVNNSWGSAGPDCNLEFQLDLQALRAANILPVFSAGNSGPDAATSTSPANNPEAFAVGAINNNGLVLPLSSRGPSACGEAETVFPEMVAPGYEIYTTNYYGLYSTGTGTSLAAPHVSGALALLLSSHPNLTAVEQSEALLGGSVDLGAAGPDNDYGYGRLDVLAAYQTLPPVDPQPSPTPTFTATPTLTPTVTFTPSPSPTPALNLALNRPVTVSSMLDSNHSGDRAVDGLDTTYWETMKPARKNPLPAEWIIVDLGGTASLTHVNLRWRDSFASRYTIEVSNNNQVWTTLYSQLNGDGGLDNIVLNGETGRYIRLYTTAWSSSTIRVELFEYEVYGSFVAPLPTPTLTATPTQISQMAVHIGDIDGTASLGNRGRWNATVKILVHGDSDIPLRDALVSGHWNGSAANTSTCTTGTDGWCSISLSNVKDTVSSVTFTVDNVSGLSLFYQPAQNHDPDGDSDGTQILILHP